MDRWFSFLSTEASLVETATSDDPDPPQGYLYQQISELTYQSPATSIKILTLLLEKLKVNSPFVRLKALKVIYQLLEKGHNTFRVELQRQSEAIRPCLGYTGPPDPLRGLSVYQQVKDQANVVLKALFTPQDDKKSIKTVSNASSPKSIEQTQRKSLEPPQTISTSPTHITNYETSSPSGSSFLSSFTSRFFGGNSDSSGLSNFGNPSLVSNYNREDENKNVVSSTTPEIVPEPKSFVQMSTEEKLVRSIILPQNEDLRIVPSPSALSDFCKICMNMSSTKLLSICKLLESTLSDPNWQVKLRSLATIEALIQSGSSDSITYFSAENKNYIELLKAMTNDVHKSLNEKSLKILKQIQPQDQEEINESVGTTNQTEKDSAQSGSSLFDGLSLQSKITIVKPNDSKEQKENKKVLTASDLTDLYSRTEIKPLPPSLLPRKEDPNDPFSFVTTVIKNEGTK